MSWSLARIVEALQAMLGVALIVEITAAAEVSDFSRFGNLRRHMAYISAWCPVSDQAVARFAAAVSGRNPGTRRHHQQLWKAHQVIGRHGEGELPADLGQPAMAPLAQPGHRLGPAEGLPDPLPDPQAEA